ncbi:MAG: tetratricopeptide repeat protein, partial [Hyphomicrobiales bacterium]
MLLLRAFFVPTLFAGLVAPAIAADEDWRDCEQGDRGGKDWRVQIAGCTRVLALGINQTIASRAMAYNKRGIAFSREGVVPDFDRAIADFGEAIRLDPKNIAAYFNRGLAYDKKGDLNRTLINYGNVIGVDPKTVNEFANKSAASKDLALADYSEVIKFDPKHADAFARRGLIYEDRDDREHARSDFEAAVAARPGDELGTAGLKRLRDKAPKIATIPGPPRWAYSQDPTPPPQPTITDAPAPQPKVAAFSCAGTKRVALVVGNSAYPGAAQLANPVNDAEDVAGILKGKLCFKVI